MTGEAALIELLKQTASGDEAAFAELYDLTSRRVFGLALRVLRDRGAAEEATLDAYESVWRRAADFDPQRGSPIAWILIIARSKAIDLLRSRSRRVERESTLGNALAAQDPGPGPEAASAQGERCAVVRSALGSLPPDQREAIEAVYFDGYTHSEAARALGEPLGTVKTRIRLGLTKLRRSLAELD